MMKDEHDEHAQVIDKVARLPGHERSKAALELGWDYDAGLSHDNWAVLKHRQRNKTLMAFRPTQWSKTRDIQADIDVAANRLENNKLYKEALDSRNRVASKYGHNPDLIGYSLGGSLAIKVGKVTGDKVTAYNPGSNPFIRESIPANVSVYRDKNDPISYGYSNLDTVNHYAGLWRFMDPLSLATGLGMAHDLSSATKSARKRRKLK